jgi:hypothetical protein
MSYADHRYYNFNENHNNNNNIARGLISVTNDVVCCCLRCPRDTCVCLVNCSLIFLCCLLFIIFILTGIDYKPKNNVSIFLPI